MDLLGTVFAALFAGDDAGLATVHATATEHLDDEAARAAHEASEAEARRQIKSGKYPLLVRAIALSARLYVDVKYRWKPDMPPGPLDGAEWEFWFEPPHRGRIDRSWVRDGRSEHVACVAHEFVAQGGARRRRAYDLAGRRLVRRPRGSPCDVDLVRHFWPVQLRRVVGVLTFDEPCEGTVAGRAVCRVRARARAEGGLWPHWLVYSADEFDLAFDLEHGHLLFVAGYRDGRELSRIEVTAVTYGEPIDPAVFSVGDGLR